MEHADRPQPSGRGITLNLQFQYPSNASKFYCRENTASNLLLRRANEETKKRGKEETTSDANRCQRKRPKNIYKSGLRPLSELISFLCNAHK